MRTWVTKHGYRIIKILGLRSNVFLLTDGLRNILVDTSSQRNWSRLKARLRSLKIGRIDAVTLTHAHYDHADNARKLRDLYGAPVIVHSAEAEDLRAGRMPTPDGTNALTRRLVRGLGPLFAAKRVEPCPNDIVIDSRYDMSPLGLNVYLLPTPGHSPGSMSVIIDDEIAAVGDAMFGVFRRSVVPPFAGDVDQMVESWGRLLDTGCRLFLAGHGSARTREELQESYEKHRGRVSRRDL